MSDLRNQIFNNALLKEKEISIKALKINVLIKELPAIKRNELMKAYTKVKKGKEVETDTVRLIPALIIETCFDPETKEQVFDKGDLDAINQLPSRIVDVLFKEASVINGMNEEEMVGN